MKKIISVFILFFLIYSCSSKNINIKNNEAHTYNATVSQNAPYISDYDSKEDLLTSPDEENLEVYEKEEIKNIVSELENNTKDIYTLQKADVLNVFGSPYLIKNEVVIELWQYRNPFCILNIIWDNSKTGIKEIVSYDNNLNKTDNRKCFLDTIKLNPDNKKQSEKL